MNVGIGPGMIIEEVARRYKKNPEELIRSKTRPAIEKRIAIYLIRRYTGLTNVEIGKIFKMKAQAVIKAGKNRALDGGEQEDKESGKKANFYFPGLTLLCPSLEEFRDLSDCLAKYHFV